MQFIKFRKSQNRISYKSLIFICIYIWHETRLLRKQMQDSKRTCHEIGWDYHFAVSWKHQYRSRGWASKGGKWVWFADWYAKPTGRNKDISSLRGGNRFQHPHPLGIRKGESGQESPRAKVCFWIKALGAAESFRMGWESCSGNQPLTW